MTTMPSAKSDRKEIESVRGKGKTEPGTGFVLEVENSCSMDGFYREIETLGESGIKSVEIHAAFLLDKRDEDLCDLKRGMDEKSVSLCSVHAPFGPESDLSSLNAEIREDAIRQHITVLKKMSIAEIPVLTVHSGCRIEKAEDKLYRENLFRNSLERILKDAEKCRVQIAVENLIPMYPAYSAEEIKKIIDEFDTPFLGACFDTGHANLGGGVKEGFEAVRENILDLHIHDNDGKRDLHLQPAYGNINWQEFFAMAGETTGKRPLMLESVPWQGRKLSWMFREVEMLRDGRLLTGTAPVEHFLRCKKCGHFVYGPESAPVCYCKA